MPAPQRTRPFRLHTRPCFTPLCPFTTACNPRGTRSPTFIPITFLPPASYTAIHHCSPFTRYELEDPAFMPAAQRTEARLFEEAVLRAYASHPAVQALLTKPAAATDHAGRDRPGVEQAGEAQEQRAGGAQEQRAGEDQAGCAGQAAAKPIVGEERRSGEGSAIGMAAVQSAERSAGQGAGAPVPRGPAEAEAEAQAATELALRGSAGHAEGSAAQLNGGRIDLEAVGPLGYCESLARYYRWTQTAGVVYVACYVPTGG